MATAPEPIAPSYPPAPLPGLGYSIFGYMLLFTSLVVAFFALIADTSVDQETRFGSERVINIGLQQHQMLLAMTAATMFIGALLLLATGSLLRGIYTKRV